MSYWWRKAWVTQKRAIALRLNEGEGGAGYPEAAIVLCAALSALSAERWPGKGIDKRRFIELLVRLGSFRDYCATISVPLLAQWLKATGRVAEATEVARVFGLPATARVLTGPEIDRSEFEVLSICPNIGITDLRRLSYACLLYEEVRSSYAHEYRPGDSADSLPMTMKPDQRVSYINRLVDETLLPSRLIHFHVAWLGDLAVDLAETLDAETVAEASQPARWWIDGG